MINYTLKQQFDLFDEDGSGTISINELEKLISESFSDIILKMENHSNQKVLIKTYLDSSIYIK